MSDSDSKVDRQAVGEWFSPPYVWRIPVYQRHYAWDAKEPGPVHLFWDIVKKQVEKRLEGSGQLYPHYLGAVLVDEQRGDGLGKNKYFNVVDGQQRLTTIQLAILALIKSVKEQDLKKRISKELENYVFSNKDAKPNPESRLRPTNFDERQFQSALFDVYGVVTRFKGGEVSDQEDEKSKVFRAFGFFRKECEELIKRYSSSPQHEAEDVINAIKETLINGFDLVLIQLHENDDAQRVFESLNNYAEPLTTFDLIRNSVFERASPGRASSEKTNLDEELFRGEKWQFLEDDYWGERADQTKKQGEAPTHIEACIARALVSSLRKTINFTRSEIFKAYKEEFCIRFSSIDEEIEALVRYAKIYQYLDSGKSKNPIEGCDFGLFHPYRVWGKRDYYPLMFRIVESESSNDEKQKMIKLLESYVVRREICGLSPKPYNKHAAAICEKLGDKPTYEKLHGFLVVPVKPTSVYPKDEMVLKGCLENDFYKSSLKCYIFEQIERHITDKKERGKWEGNLTIDHILPQAWDKEDGWKAELGEGVDSLTITSYINTIGNLTLMSAERNIAKSNRSWKVAKGLLCDSDMRMNRELTNQDVWGVEKIKARSRALKEKICEIWPYDIK